MKKHQLIGIFRIQLNDQINFEIECQFVKWNMVLELVFNGYTDPLQFGTD